VLIFRAGTRPPKDQPVRASREKGLLQLFWLGWQKDLTKKMLPEAVFLLPTLTCKGVMVLAAQIVRELARFGLESRFWPRLKVSGIFSFSG
jgi:hypothetical protein